MLDIHTLGGLSIWRDGQLVPGLTSRKAEGLLVYLAATGRAHPREVLAELLWQDRSQDQAMTNLRKVIAELRQGFAPYVEITRQTIDLNPTNPIWLDVVELDAGLASQQKGQTEILSPASADRLEQALALYQGDFLAGFYVRDCQGFEEWMLTERERLRRQVIEALHCLVNSYLDSDQFSLGIKQATRLLQLDPLREEAYRQMMTLLAKTGQRADALSQYEMCCRLLSDELGIQPAAETTSLYVAIQSGTLTKARVPLQPVIAPRPKASSIPRQSTPFIGRTSELAQIAERLSDTDCHWLTLVGAGGIGKTRLALQVAHEHDAAFAHGARFVPLTEVNSADAIVVAIASALNFSFNNLDLPAVQLVNYLRSREMLLILDNFEHLLTAAPLLTDLIANAPRMKIILTSRERLNLPEEWVLQVEGMDYPRGKDDNEAESFSAVQLFVYNARRVQAGFSLIHDRHNVLRICQLVEGMPLGIELAATWLRLLPCARIAEYLASDPDFLASPLRNVPQRHHSLRAVFDQSWAMLSTKERAVLARLSVFRGGFDLEAAEQVAGASLAEMASLADKSVIRIDDEERCHLHELLRVYAADKLGDDTVDTMQRHFNYFLKLAERAEADLFGPRQLLWFDRLEANHDNLRAALIWSLSRPDSVAGLRLAASLAWFWQFQGDAREGQKWLTQLLAANPDASSFVRAKALHRAAAMAFDLDDDQQGRALADEALRISRAAGDTWNTAWSLAAVAYAVKETLAVEQEQALILFRQLGDAWGIMQSLHNLLFLTARLGDTKRAIAFGEEALALARIAGDRRSEAWILLGLGRAYHAASNFERATAAFQESLPAFLAAGDPGTGVYLNMAKVAFDLRDDVLARSHYLKALTLETSLVSDINAAGWLATACLVGLAVLDWRQGKVSAAKLLGAIETYLRGQGSLARTYFFDLDKQMAELYPGIDEPASATARAEGQTLTLEQACAYALGTISDVASTSG